MTIQGVYLEPVAILSDDFQDFETRFQYKLVSLYEINYAEMVHGYLGEATEWDATTYYHGTTHCGCIEQHIYNDRNSKIKVQDWCKNTHCCTKGIMTSGHLRTKLRTAMEGAYTHTFSLFYYWRLIISIHYCFCLLNRVLDEKNDGAPDMYVLFFLLL